MTRTKLADTADWLGRGLIDQVRNLSRLLKPRLAPLQKRFETRLRHEGFDPAARGVLVQVTPLAASQMLLRRQTLTRFFESVDTAGRHLARLNVTPGDVTRALQICDEVINADIPDSDYGWAREQLSFCTILALNHAYYAIREAEAQTFYELFHAEVQSSNIDVLFRRFVETMAVSCGAAAGHLFLLTDDGQHWQLKASTAQAASQRTLAVRPAQASSRRALSKARRIEKSALILDAGWLESFPCVWSIPVTHGGVVQFAFASDRDLLPRELEMLTAAGERCQAAAQKARLLEEIAQREEQLSKLAYRMLMVEENERRRISRELHDDAGQSLVVIRLQMEMIESSLPEGSEERERLGEARDITEKTILDIRRLISDLSPAVLEQLGLGAALRQLVNRFKARYACQVRLNVGQLPTLDTNFQLVIYRLAQECFNNIAQHSEATGVNISVDSADSVLRLHVEDNGNGFHVSEALARKDCFGLAGIRERVAVLGGIVSIKSTRKEGHQSSGSRKKTGTVIGIELPIPRENSRNLS